MTAGAIGVPEQIHLKLVDDAANLLDQSRILGVARRRIFDRIDEDVPNDTRTGLAINLLIRIERTTRIGHRALCVAIDWVYLHEKNLPSECVMRVAYERTHPQATNDSGAIRLLHQIPLTEAGLKCEYL